MKFFHGGTKLIKIGVKEKNSKKSIKEEETKKNVKTEDEKSLKSEIVDLYKTKVKESNTLVDMNNIKDWVVTKIIYHGYNKNDF